MQALLLMATYILTTAALQTVGFGISRIVEYQFPLAGLMTFLILFMLAFGLAWPIAVRIAEWGLVKGGFILETNAPWVPSPKSVTAR